MRDFEQPGRSAVFAERGICATSHPAAALAAVDVLRSGGNAVDAAIAGAVMLGLCEPQMTGIGGDCFALVNPGGTQDIFAMNASGRAPAGLDAQALRDLGPVVDKNSVHSVTVPGAVDGFCALSERFGRQGIAASLAPAIDLFERGVPVAPRVARDWAKDADRLQGSAREVYLNGGQAPGVGQMFALPGQADVLRRIAAGGRDAFYTGEVAEDMLAGLNALGGVHRAEDFAATKATWEDPITTPYRGYELVEHPPNGQGAAALLLANILGHFDMAGMDPMGAARIHLEAEATKLAYGTRNALLADPAHMADAAALQDPALAAKLAAKIDPNRVADFGAGISGAAHKDTIYITVVDEDRMAVSLIYSVFHSFGSGIASPKFGILMQNRGAGFSLEQGHPNEAGPGKRPMHTIIPGMLRHGGKVIMPFGVMGGQYQATGHVRLMSDMVDFGFDPQTSFEKPRAFAVDGALEMETGYDAALCAQLEQMGHRVIRPETPIGGAQAIRLLENGVLEGASDPRKDGCALGY
ncbi:gamma-glutamyltransferase family protein [Alphaproteobacteria bacterium KMM 3653]|uniref:Gamma-glutamyltransferase family protein n=1 Tax=Harenicola maris TaxID=2841044 RepID=A0AAP2CR08_9RHOB|nr:gamma-glutamyltransferase family protein [Harenicola maris]